MTADEIADVLERAADALFIYGRCKVFASNAKGQMCALGAVHYAENGEVDEDAIYESSPAKIALAEYLAEHSRRPLSGEIQNVWAWNDDTDDDAAVIDTIKHCAKDLRAVHA